VVLISSIIYISRHFMVAKDPAPPEALSDKHAPFYENKVGHCITPESAKLDELKCLAT